MDSEHRRIVVSFLETLPQVEFCCVYGSSLHTNNLDKSSMIDLILGVADPQQWHAENLKRNRDHYAPWIAHFGGAQLITDVADEIGVGVHFNPFVPHKDKVDLIVDTLNVRELNELNLTASVAATLLLWPSLVTEVQLYSNICRLSYMGDVRMLFAEDRDKVAKIVNSQLPLFQTLYRPRLKALQSKEVIRMFYDTDQTLHIQEGNGKGALLDQLPRRIISLTEAKLGSNIRPGTCPDGAAYYLQTVLKRKVMISSARQAVAGLLSAGINRGLRYAGRKMLKAWKSYRW
ncbi:uncharacterized protein LOC127262645 isoform X2 [Andrographis paniculata]|uniref:uncharacterized protein LOC127262645 isoform X2 n=1 Tax=Andrographis paniculata TaxID=175694 RepID=UPI0021E8ECB1|nr:uncharacterized protein LOC127262645 isoform X2 [Andrographis paniculata]